MKDIVVSVILIAVGIVGLTNVDQIQQLYDEAYAVSAGQSQVLDRCAAASKGGDRIEAGKCLSRMRSQALQLGGRDTLADDRKRVR